MSIDYIPCSNCKRRYSSHAPHVNCNTCDVTLGPCCEEDPKLGGFYTEEFMRRQDKKRTYEVQQMQEKYEYEKSKIRVELKGWFVCTPSTESASSEDKQEEVSESESDLDGEWDENKYWYCKDCSKGHSDIGLVAPAWEAVQDTLGMIKFMCKRFKVTRQEMEEEYKRKCFIDEIENDSLLKKMKAATEKETDQQNIEISASSVASAAAIVSAFAAVA